MLQKLRAAAVGAALLFAASAFADDPKSVDVKVDGNKYSVSAYTMGSAEIVGYLGDQKDDKGIEAVVWTGRGATADREADLAKMASRAGLKAFVREGGKLRSIDVKPGDK